MPAILILLFVGIPVDAVGIALMWGWFVAEPFHIPQIGVAQAIGLRLLLGFLRTGQPGLTAEDRERYQQTNWAVTFVGVKLMTIVIAGLWHMWVIK
jgi:hypothetical protein